MASKEGLDHTYAKQSQQLTETRQQAKLRLTKSDMERGTMKDKLETLDTEMERLKSKEEEVSIAYRDSPRNTIFVAQLSVFKIAVQRLLLSYQEGLGEDRGTQSDYDLIATLEKVVGSQKKHSDNTKCLEASLRQLELGFKSNYKDTLTILSSE